LRFARYADKAKLIAATEAPAAPNWESVFLESGTRPKRDRDPLGNNRAGCCVFSAPAHDINLIRQFGGAHVPEVTAEMVLAEYAKRTGWDPVTGANDNGYYIRVMLEIWRTEGLFGTKLLAYCAVDWNDPDEVRLALWLGGGLIGGYDLPLASQDQQDVSGRQLWYVPEGGWKAGHGPGTWGGHALYKFGTSPGGDQDNSWGESTISTPGWRKDCCSELWLPIVDIWVAGAKAPNGFALDDLLADVRARGV
jgi:hypothetical protein